MALSWDEVVKGQQYQSWKPEDRLQAREQYFNEVVIPNLQKDNVPADRVPEAKQQFFDYTRQVDPILKAQPESVPHLYEPLDQPISEDQQRQKDHELMAIAMEIPTLRRQFLENSLETGKIKHGTPAGTEALNIIKSLQGAVGEDPGTFEKMAAAKGYAVSPEEKHRIGSMLMAPGSVEESLTDPKDMLINIALGMVGVPARGGTLITRGIASGLTGGVSEYPFAVHGLGKLGWGIGKWGTKKTVGAVKGFAGRRVDKEMGNVALKVEESLSSGLVNEMKGARVVDKIDSVAVSANAKKLSTVTQPGILEKTIQVGKNKRLAKDAMPEDLFKAIPEKDLPKYASSVNLKKQKIPIELKSAEVKMAETFTKKVQGWTESLEKAKEIYKDPKMLKRLQRLKSGKAFETAEESIAMRQLNADAVDGFHDIVMSIDDPVLLNKYFQSLNNDIFKTVSSASGETGRMLNAHKIELWKGRLGATFSKLEKGLNKRQIEEFRKLDRDNPLMIKEFIERLPDPKLRHYVMEFWYNNVLSGIPTHVVNVSSNTAWMAFQGAVHRPLVAGMDKVISTFTGRERQVFLNEVVPFWTGVAKGFKSGKGAAKEAFLTGRNTQFSTKLGMEIGAGVTGAFERSPNTALKWLGEKRVTNFFLRGLNAMDVWAKSMGYDAQLGALAKRAGMKKGLRGDALRAFEEKLLMKPTLEMKDDAMRFAEYLTFTDEPGALSKGVQTIRKGLWPTQFIVPFVNTVGNLMKRGLEMTPGVGLAFKKSHTWAELMAKQVEGAALSLYIMNKYYNGEITGAAPENAAEREHWYAQGNIPYSIKFGKYRLQYSRVEPFNTIISSVTSAANAISNAPDETTATEQFGMAVNGVINGIIDQSYAQGIQTVLDKRGRRKGMVQRFAASFVPYSGFWRSLNRSIEAVMTGTAKVRETNTFLGAFSQVIPGLYDLREPRLSAWGEEIPIEGSVFRHWLPYKWSTGKYDKTEEVLASLDRYPGLPKKVVTIGKEKVELPDNIYREFCISYGNQAKEALDSVVGLPGFDRLRDDQKLSRMNRIMTKIRNRERARAIRIYKMYNE
jgi:hypothetical protein